MTDPRMIFRVVELIGYDPEDPEKDELLGYGVMGEKDDTMHMVSTVYGTRSEAVNAVEALRPS